VAPEFDSDAMDEEETTRDETGALSLSTNATAFCIASLIGAGDRHDGDVDRHDGNAGPVTTESETGYSDSAADSDDDGNESQITSEVASNDSEVITILCTQTSTFIRKKVYQKKTAAHQSWQRAKN